MPLRLEIGPKDIEKTQVVLARRDTREKTFVPMDGLAAHVEQLLDDDSDGALRRAVAFRERAHHDDRHYDEFKAIIDGRPGFVVVAVVRRPTCEAEIKTETQATIRNIPFDSRTRPARRASSAARRRPFRH